MDAHGEQKPNPSLLKPVTRRQAAYQQLQEIASMENKLTLNFRDWMNKGATSQTAKVQSSVELPSSTPMPQTQTGQMLIKDEPWQDPTELSYAGALALAAADWIGPIKDSSNKIHTHYPSDEVKLMLTYPSGNPTPRPTPQPDPTPTSNTAQLHLSNLSTNQVQGTSIPRRPCSGLKRKTRDDEKPPQPLPTPSQATSNGNMVKKSADNLLCHLCQASCSSALTLQQHLKGRPHKAKMEYMKLKRNCTTTGRRQGKPRCDVCQIWCSDVDALEMHFKGQKHKTNLQELQLCRQSGGQKSSKAPIICELCRIPCMNQALYEQHLKGRQHVTKEELKRRGFH